MDQQILSKLNTPFHSSLVEWKPQALSSDRQFALVVAYVDLRDYEDRLDEAFPEWTSSVQFVIAEKKVAAIVSLTIAGVTRVNVGEASLDDENAFTSAYAQGFKRVCSDFGLGRYLYRLPQEWCAYDEKRRAIVAPPELPVWARHPDEIAVENQALKNAQPNGTLGEPERSKKEGDSAANPGETVVHFGRYNGKTLEEVWALGKEGQGWVRWCANTDGKGFNTKNDPENVRLQRMARAFLAVKTAYAG